MAYDKNLVSKKNHVSILSTGYMASIKAFNIHNESLHKWWSVSQVLYCVKDSSGIGQAYTNYMLGICQDFYVFQSIVILLQK